MRWVMGERWWARDGVGGGRMAVADEHASPTTHAIPTFQAST